MRRGMLVMSEGFSYRRNRSEDTTDYLRCRISNNDKIGCGGRAVLDRKKGIFYVTKPHTCQDKDFVYFPNSRIFQQL